MNEEELERLRHLLRAGVLRQSGPTMGEEELERLRHLLRAIMLQQLGPSAAALNARANPLNRAQSPAAGLPARGPQKNALPKLPSQRRVSPETEERDGGFVEAQGQATIPVPGVETGRSPSGPPADSGRPRRPLTADEIRRMMQFGRAG